MLNGYFRCFLCSCSEYRQLERGEATRVRAVRYFGFMRYLALLWFLMLGGFLGWSWCSYLRRRRRHSCLWESASREQVSREEVSREQDLWRDSSKPFYLYRILLRSLPLIPLRILVRRNCRKQNQHSYHYQARVWCIYLAIQQAEEESMQKKFSAKMQKWLIIFMFCMTFSRPSLYLKIWVRWIDFLAFRSRQQRYLPDC